MPTPAHTLVAADGARPDKWMLFLHGILGRGANLRPIARKVVTARPGWGAVLVDLRMHGASQAFPPPHTVAAAAEDLLALESVVPGRIAGVLGHSFGGKVALEHWTRRADALEHVWTVDSSPSPRPPERGDSPTREVIKILEELPPRIPSREVLVERVVAAGLSRSIGEWLAMNLERRSEGSPNGGKDEWVLALDLRAIHQLLDSYFALDLWPVVDALPGEARLHAIIGGRSGVWTKPDRARLDARIASAPDRVDARVLDTGHWVHVEDPAGLVRAIVEAL